VAANLCDTNVLIYRFDYRYPIKRRIARDLLREGAGDGSLVLAHQSIVEFVAAASRPRADLGGQPLLPPERARLYSEGFEHGRHYGNVRVVDPFLVAADAVHELPPMYAGRV
jgi:predicted nucleic acid-binding protein